MKSYLLKYKGSLVLRSLLERYDQIYVLQEGQVVEQGSFGELMELGGYFYSLYMIENKTFKPAALSDALPSA